MKHKPSETVSAQNGESEQMAGALWVMALLVKMIMMMIIKIAMTRIFNINMNFTTLADSERLSSTDPASKVERKSRQVLADLRLSLLSDEIVIMVR